MRRATWRCTAAAAAVVLVGLIVPADARPQSTSTTYRVQEVRIASGPVLTDDGKGAYTPLGSTYLRDATVPDASGFKDWMRFVVGDGNKPTRFARLWDDRAGVLAKCVIAEVDGTSATTLDWLHEIGIGESTAADGALRCFSDTRRQRGWIIGYPSGALADGSGNTPECLVISHPTAKQWTLSSDGTCPSKRWEVVNGSYVPNGDPFFAPAPFSITWTLP